ncbi:hypothetical protein CFC21_048106 [Triticum aestivum]|nr:uncharacterized protein LOC109780892 [Aegilops tauschii subsp. strangulata]XP_044353454.1 uncharacterized protein LOC123074761 [Triticum aestivum]KAF7037815.1 hypothetical protein CFC21_048106 [Triticum aestivum]
MEGIVQLQQEREHCVTEVPEVDGAELLVELLDASLAVEEEEEEAAAVHGKRHQLGFPADDVGDGWVDDGLQELNLIHPHQEAGCEDCGLDGIVVSGFDGCGCSPGPYVLDDDGNAVGYWAEEMEGAAFGFFNGDRVGEWYSDGMAMEWDEGRSYCSFYPSYGGEACAEQPYISPLWE